jgi:hypothetical protein
MDQNANAHNFRYRCALVPKLGRQLLGHVWYLVAGSRSTGIDFGSAGRHTVGDMPKQQKLDNATTL